MKIPCINLRERFGRRFKIRYAEDYFAEYGPNARVEDPWYMEIPCQNGHISPWGGSTLAACTKAAGRVANRLKTLPFTTVAQDGTDGANVLFDAEDFEAVAEIMKPRRRRCLSPEARRAAEERLAKYQFQPAVGSPETGPESTIRPRVDSEHLPRQFALFGDRDTV